MAADYREKAEIDPVDLHWNSKANNKERINFAIVIQINNKRGQITRSSGFAISICH